MTRNSRLLALALRAAGLILLVVGAAHGQVPTSATTPNPTSGFLILVPKKNLIRLSMTVEDAVRPTAN